MERLEKEHRLSHNLYLEKNCCLRKIKEIDSI